MDSRNLSLRDRIPIKQLTVHTDDRGWVYELLRNDDPQFLQYGQAYVSVSRPGVVKGFHLHYHQTDNVACVSGEIKLVLIDNKTRELMELYIGDRNPLMVTIPPGIWHAWKCISTEPSLIVNILTHPFFPDRPDETRVDPHKFEVIPGTGEFYSWARVDR